MAASVESGGGADLHSQVAHVCVTENGVWDSQTTKGLQNLLNKCHRAQDWEAAVAAARRGDFGRSMVRPRLLTVHTGRVRMIMLEC